MGGNASWDEWSLLEVEMNRRITVVFRLFGRTWLIINKFLQHFQILETKKLETVEPSVFVEGNVAQK